MTLREVAAGAAVRWMARSLGFERAARRRDAGGVRSGAAAAGADDVHRRVMRAVGVFLALIGGFGSS